ncbi:kinase-like domain-containing protein [Cyathus striatus]|nr:kinase-like domain-containing protein [Cyathus striatus]
MLGPPDALRFLGLVKAAFASDPSTYLSIIQILLDRIYGDSNHTAEQLSNAIGDLASIFRQKPHLVLGINALLPRGYRIQCPRNVEHVDFYVLTTPCGTEIRSTCDFRILGPSNLKDLHELLGSGTLTNVNYFGSDQGYLSCIAQLLQDNLDCSGPHRRSTVQCLTKLSNNFVLPPSLFLSNIQPKSGHSQGGGSFADIYEGIIGGTKVCLKVLRTFSTPGSREKLHKEFAREALVWRQLNHPNVLPFLGANDQMFHQRFCLVSPWMENGNIMQFLERHPNHDRFKAIQEIVNGIRYLHELDPPVTHKDIKGANILVTRDHVCCLADFGLSSIVLSQSERLSSSPALQGSMCWLAPEMMDTRLLLDSCMKLPADIYSLGCTIYEIFTGKPPFGNYPTGVQVMFDVLKGDRPLVPPPERKYVTTQEQQLWEIVRQSWQGQPSDRPSVQEVDEMLHNIHSIFQEPDSPVEMLSSPSLPISLSRSSSQRQSMSPRGCAMPRIREWLLDEQQDIVRSGSVTPVSDFSQLQSSIPDLATASNENTKNETYLCSDDDLRIAADNLSRIVGQPPVQLETFIVPAFLTVGSPIQYPRSPTPGSITGISETESGTPITPRSRDYTNTTDMHVYSGNFYSDSETESNVVQPVVPLRINKNNVESVKEEMPLTSPVIVSPTSQSNFLQSDVPYYPAWGRPDAPRLTLDVSFTRVHGRHPILRHSYVPFRPSLLRHAHGDSSSDGSTVT